MTYLNIVRSQIISGVLFMALAGVASAEEIKVALGAPAGDYDQFIETGESPDRKYVADGKPLSVHVTLPDKQEFKLEAKQVELITLRCLTGGVALRLPLDEGLSEAEAFAATKEVLTANGWGKGWDAELKEWREFGGRNFSCVESISEKCEVEVRIRRDRDGWGAMLAISIKRDAFFEMLKKAMEGRFQPPHATVEISEGGERNIAILPDGEAFITEGERAVEIRKIANGELVQNFDIGADINGLRLSRDGKLFAIHDIGAEKTEIRDIASGKKVADLPGSPHLSPDFSIFFKGGAAGMRSFSVDTGKPLAKYADTSRGDLRGELLGGFSEDGARLRIEEGIYDVKSGQKICDFKDPYIEALFTKGGKTVICCETWTPSIVEVDAASGEVLMSAKVLCGNNLTLSPDGKIIAVSTMGNTYADNEICLYDREGKLLHQLGLFELSPSAMAFTPDGKQLVVAMAYSEDIHIWDLAELKK